MYPCNLFQAEMFFFCQNYEISLYLETVTCISNGTFCQISEQRLSC